MPGKFKRMAATLRAVYSPKYMALNVAVAIVYYLVFVALVKYQNYGILLMSSPRILIYALIASSSIMFTIGIYAIRNSMHKPTKVSASVVGTAAALFSGIVSGCGCAAPLLFGITYLGFSVVEVSALESFIARYNAVMISAILALNVALILYYSSRISRARRI